MKCIWQLLAPLFFFRLSFGGDSSSSSTSSTTLNQFDQRAVTGTGGISTSGSNNVISVSNTETDMGAVQAGTDLARRTTALAFASAADSAAQVRSIADAALGQVSAAYETAKAGDQRVTSMVAMAAVAMVAFAVVPAIFRKG